MSSKTELKAESLIFVAGHRGLVGSAIVRALQSRGCTRLLLRSRAELDLGQEKSVQQFFDEHRPEVVFLAAAKVGGIMANQSRPFDFLYENLLIQNHVLSAAHRSGVRKLVFLGSSCIYPKMSPQPIPETALLTGPLEPTNEWYAVAKIAGIKLCQALRRQHGCNFISLMPTNLYGPNDNYDLQSSHVLPAFIRRFHEAKVEGREKVICWGSGAPLREFLHADDLSDACLFLMENYSDEEIINVGSGQEVTIGDLARLIARVVGYKGAIEWDRTKPDGTPRKLLDCTRLSRLGWKPRIGLEEGIGATYADFLKVGEGAITARPLSVLPGAF